MSKHIRENFVGQRVILDGHDYDHCTFQNCTIVFKGGDFKLNVCQIHPGCKFALEDAAGRTLGFLQNLYHGMGDGGMMAVEGIFNAVRRRQQPMAVSKPAPDGPLN